MGEINVEVDAVRFDWWAALGCMLIVFAILASAAYIGRRDAPAKPKPVTVQYRCVHDWQVWTTNQGGIAVEPSGAGTCGHPPNPPHGTGP